MVNKHFTETCKNRTRENANVKVIIFQASVGGFKVFKRRYGLHETILGEAASADQGLRAMFPEH